MKMNYTLAALSVASLTMAGTSLTAQGQDDSWRFGFTVPLWAAGIDGDVTLQGLEQDVEVSFEDLKEQLDASFSLAFEARKGKFGFYSGGSFMEFSASAATPGGGGAEAELKFLIADVGVSYVLIKTGEENPFVLEATAGLRYWRTDTDLTISDSLGTVLFSGGNDRDLLDPVIGLRGSKYLTAKLHLDFAGDIGGFGLSDDTSDLAWSAAGLVSYDFTKGFTLSAGYKALALDVERDSGASQNGMDIVMNGVLITAKFKF